MAGRSGQSGSGNYNRRYESDGRSYSRTASSGRSSNSSSGRSTGRSTGSKTASERYRSSETAGSRSGGQVSRRQMINNTSIKRARELEKQKKLRQKKRRRTTVIIIVIIVVLLAAFAALYFNRKKAVENYVTDETIAKGVSIDGIDVSGLTVEEATEKWNNRVKELGAIMFDFKTNGADAMIPLTDLGFNVVDKTTEELVDEAYSVLRNGGILEKYRQIKQLQKTGNNIEVKYSIDLQTAKKVLQKKCVVLEGAAENAEIVFYSENHWELKESKNGIVVKIDETVAELEKIFNPWDKASHIITVAVTEDEPEITTEELSGISDVLSSYSTIYGSGNTGRVQNVETAVEHLNGIYLEPGKELSVDSIIGPYTEENGYAEAASYEDGEVVQSMGGGICQVSSTLYNAVLFAELEVTERYEHSMPVGYVQPGRDAAIADNVKDLKFKNNTDYAIYISGWCDGTSCYFYIFGKETRDPSRVITYRSEMISEEKFKTIYEDDPEMKPGTEEIKTVGRNGGKYKLYKQIHINGQLTGEEYISSSSYIPCNEIKIRGPKKDGDTEKDENPSDNTTEDNDEASDPSDNGDADTE